MAAKRRKKHKNKISERVNSVCYIEQKSECGLRPLRAVGSICEPEAAGAIGAYAPEGMWNVEFNTSVICPLSSVFRPLNPQGEDTMPLAFESLSHGTIAFGFFNIESDMLILDRYFLFAD